MHPYKLILRREESLIPRFCSLGEDEVVDGVLGEPRTSNDDGFERGEGDMTKKRCIDGLVELFHALWSKLGRR